MLSEREKRFMQQWEKEREALSSITGKIMAGLPMAMLFSLPVLLLILVVYLFIPDWYMKISKTSQGTFITVVIAVIISTIFFAYFRMYFKWETNEQHYQELKQKDSRSN